MLYVSLNVRKEADQMDNHIKSLRNQLVMSQEQLAKRLGVSRQTVISIEKGRYNPSLPLAIQIARCFDTIVEDVFIVEEGEETT